jgi:serine phosphatase RsbU (regulator of sigma subunit)
VVAVDSAVRSGRFGAGGWQVRAWREAAMVVEVCWRAAAEGPTSGDFFESTVRPDGTVAAVLGDAPGFGAAAAPVAERLAETARAALIDRRRPWQVLAALDAEAQSAGPEVVATSLCVVVDPASGSAELSSAGHLAAVLVRPGGVQRIDPAGLPLGLGGDRSAWSSHLGDQDTLFLFTDGLVERQGSVIEVGLEVAERAAAPLTAAGSWASELAHQVTEVLGPPADDVMVVSARLDRRRGQPVSECRMATRGR